VAAGHSVEVDPARWQELFDAVMGRVARRFPRVEPRRHARALVLGLLADLPRKNCWTIAEHAGQATPDGLQHLLSGAVWDHDAVRDDVRALLVEHLGEEGAVLVIDETGDLKKGTHTVRVQRQYTGTAGKVDNAQVAVYLAYATRPGTGSSTGNCTCPSSGWPTGGACGPSASPTRSASRPSPNWPAGCSSEKVDGPPTTMAPAGVQKSRRPAKCATTSGRVSWYSAMRWPPGVRNEQHGP
jgi:hypothetical protein